MTEQRRDLGYGDRYDLPSRFWEPEPPEDYEAPLSPEEDELDDLPFI